ncbi:hypothetical protein REC12_11740 [Desulfosporosinus sp. PR]|uniref:hypothetical protein n=1 Tax=Candidatus Desulfosporosinus nitrosoreducens TaxID=3401928 RepID=UPI0027ECE4AA|nr:hypothetical protein [Desulfosporosinus sp. PR]MDQ7094262.1 hypothetical protein [Desulfosporosinus sp. PR]
MGDAETQAFKEDVMEIKSDVKEVKNAVDRLHLLMVEKYVTRKEFEVFKDREVSSRRWWATFIIGAVALVVTVMDTVHYFL